MTKQKALPKEFDKWHLMALQLGYHGVSVLDAEKFICAAKKVERNFGLSNASSQNEFNDGWAEVNKIGESYCIKLPSGNLVSIQGKGLFHPQTLSVN